MERSSNKLKSSLIAVSSLITAMFGFSGVQGVNQASASQIQQQPATIDVPPVVTPNGAGPVLVGEVMPVSDAIDAVGEKRIARANPGTPNATIEEMSTDSDAYVDRTGRLLYLDQGLATGIERAQGNHPAMGSIEITTSPFAALADTFLLESRPGSNRTIYLDFNGATVVGTGWNTSGNEVITAPAFDRDGDPSNFSEYERTFIQEVWSQVSEDYAPFDVNVTTKDLGEDAYIRQSGWDNNYGSHVVITNEVVGNVCGGFNCAGVGYVGSFDSQWNSYYQPAWSFAFEYGPIYASLTISHEVGHNLGLSHDGKSSEYYGGQGNWGPIMGGGATRPIFQWSKGDYSSPTNTENDYEVMGNNGLSILSDDYADDASSASLTTLATPIDGIITTSGDVDVFKMEISAGTLNLRVTPATHSPNLDVQLDLYDSTATTLLAQGNTASSYSNTQNLRTTYTSTGMGASLSYDSPSSQTVYVKISGVGEGNPLTTGYNDYGSLGRYTLSKTNSELEITVHGPGTVTSVASGINCADSCTSTHDPSTSVALTATPSAGATVAYWLGACEASQFDLSQTTTCTVPMDQARDVAVVFRYNRTVTVSTSGSGTVGTTTNGWSISCGSTCSDTDWRPYITLTATPSGGSVFSAWSGGCTSEVTTCTLYMTESKNVTATFVTESVMNVSVVGDGSVSSNPSGISCDGPTSGTPCSHTFAAAASVALTATPDAANVFTGWSGACSGTSTCTVSMNAARDVTATFASGGTLSVSIVGSGTVTSNIGGLSCDGPTSGTPCTQDYLTSETVELTATADYLNTFGGWSGACSGTSTCTVSMSEARSVTATFVPDYLLQVTLAGTGSGTVVSNVGVIACTSELYSPCGQYFAEGTQVTLTATDGPGFFTGWSGACSGSSRTCVVTIDSSNNVTASFELGDATYLMINGEGSFTTSRGRVECNGSMCTAYRPSGSSAEITAVPAVGNVFTGWSSGCTGLGTCSLPTEGGASPMATFVKQSPIVAGENFSCRAAGSGAKCWGLNSSGQIGNNSLASVKKSTSVNGLTSVAAVTAGGQHACAVLNNGTVKCWGENGNGQLGNNSTTDAKTPVLVSGLSDVQTISAGSAHTCALLEDGTVKCWGKGADGRLGNGTTPDKKTPTSVSGITTGSPAVAISAGGSHTCALLRNATVKCWGLNSSGQVGNGSFTSAKVPAVVSGLAGARAISTGGAHSCAVLAAGTVKCWGENGNGQLGNNSTTDAKAPVSVAGVSGATIVSAGGSHTCSNAQFGWSFIAKCWGNGANGRLGAGDTVSKRTAVNVTGISSPSALSAGGAHTCVATQAMFSDTYTFRCWGAGASGQIGNNAVLDKYVATLVL